MKIADVIRKEAKPAYLEKFRSAELTKHLRRMKRYLGHANIFIYFLFLVVPDGIDMQWSKRFWGRNLVELRAVL